VIVEPVTLRGSVIVLEPLRMEHVDALARAGMDPELWRWTQQRVKSRDDMERYVITALDETARGTALPFAIIERSSGAIIGSTRYAEISVPNRRVEIGWTWITPAYQRTAVNTEAKLLLLRHAFEVLRTIKVQLKTDALNNVSRRAILRLGATEEGILRKHSIAETGRVRDLVYYSILDTEWPAIKRQLEQKLRSY
jgi:N-acetyltransferase